MANILNEAWSLVRDTARDLLQAYSVGPVAPDFDELTAPVQFVGATDEDDLDVYGGMPALGDDVLVYRVNDDQYGIVGTWPRTLYRSTDVVSYSSTAAEQDLINRDMPERSLLGDHSLRIRAWGVWKNDGAAAPSWVWRIRLDGAVVWRSDVTPPMSNVPRGWELDVQLYFGAGAIFTTGHLLFNDNVAVVSGVAGGIGTITGAILNASSVILTPTPPNFRFTVAMNEAGASVSSDRRYLTVEGV